LNHISTFLDDVKCSIEGRRKKAAQEWYKLQQNGQGVGFPIHHNHGQCKSGEVLLMLDLFVNGDECFKTGSDSNGDQCAIAKLLPLHLSCCADFVSRQVFAQSAGQIMVEQNLHGYGFGRSSSR
jgi:hypothetical protein